MEVLNMTTKTHISAESRAEQARQQYREAAGKAADGDANARTKLPRLFAALEAAEHEARIAARVAQDVEQAREARRLAESEAQVVGRRRNDLERAVEALDERAKLAEELAGAVANLAAVWGRFDAASRTIGRAQRHLGRSGPPLLVGQPEGDWVLGILARAMNIEDLDVRFARYSAPTDLGAAVARRNVISRRILEAALNPAEVAA
jgi:phage gpG-like protein